MRIVLLGDSTVADYQSDRAERGWGQMLPAHFGKEAVFANFAVCGASSKTFTSEGHCARAMGEKADWALIQFGHNDSHGAGKPEATDAETDFAENIRRYVSGFRNAGARPILVTPPHRRCFDYDGKPTEELAPYARSLKRVAAEMNVPVVDLHEMTGELFGQLGDEGSADLSCRDGDRSHFSEKGARVLAEMVFRGLMKAEPGLREYAAHKETEG